MKLLIDECLSPQLAERAQQQGHEEATHVVWRGWAGKKDWELIKIILDGDWTFVTRNAVDFRGQASRLGVRGQYARAGLHAGLICLMGPEGMDLAAQLDLFDHALDLVGEGDLVNQVLEVVLDDDGYVSIRRYALPP